MLVAKLVASDGRRDDLFGTSVAVGGQTIAVGTSAITFGCFADANEPVHVFRDNGKDWTLEAKSMAFGGGARDTVSISGGTILAGSSTAWTADEQYPPFDNCSSAAATVFAFSAKDGWTQRAVLVPSDIARGDAFGWVVALGGAEAVIGSWRNGEGGIDAGAAYIDTGLGDCNGNDILDACDIANGTSGDANGDRVFDFFDVSAYLGDFAAGCP